MSMISTSIGNELLGALQDELAEAKSTLSAEDKAILERALKRLAVLIAQRVSPTPSVAVEVIDQEMAVVSATLANYRAVAALVLARASGRVVEMAGRVLGHIARGLLAGALGM